MFAIEAATPLKTLRPSRTIDVLGRLFAIEKEVLRLQGARLPELESWFLKQRVVHNLFEDAQHASQLLERRRELPGGRGAPQALNVLDADLANALMQCLFASGDACFCAALYLGVKPLLAAAYREHLERSTPVSDLPTRRIVERIIANEEEQIAWVRGALAMKDLSAAERRDILAWRERIEQLVAAAGGIMGEGTRQADALPPARIYEPAVDARREPRQTVTFGFVTPKGAGVDQGVVDQFTSFFKEMAATETIAVMLWEAPKELPWEFYADTARHCWDEVRHCQAGQQRLEQLGFDIWKVPVMTGAYNVRSRMPLLERYAYLTQFQERLSFDGKHENENRFRAAGDTVSADMVAYDIADETAHVKFGLRWIPELQKTLGDRRSMEELLADSKCMYETVEASLRPK